ncbi:MAG: alpha/beta hydrolase, partial [Krumholzibacteria bacterium]|nr:alpha/beta hydrolase [Candidatus Krumholzibacteria bacterium]
MPSSPLTLTAAALVVLLVVVAVLGGVGGCSRAVMTAAEAMALSRPPADARLAYADHPSGFGELRLPSGEGPFPVVVLVHGGCWLAEYDLGYMAGLAAALTAEGWATWTIEYRRVGEEGGG